MSRLIYGINPVREALRTHPHEVRWIKVGKGRGGVKEIIELAEASGIRVESVPIRSLSSIVNTDKHQGIVAGLSPYRYVDLDDILRRWRSSGEKAFILILDSIQDPHNAGSLIRTACCAGVHGIVITKDRSVDITPTVVKSSAGATEHMPIARVTNLRQTIERLKDAGLWIIGLDAGADMSIFESGLDLDIGLVVGSEGKGIRELVKRSCDLLLSLPLKGGIGSLNASVAGGIAIYEVLRRRLKPI